MPYNKDNIDFDLVDRTIKKKNIHITFIKMSSNLKEYNDWVYDKVVRNKKQTYDVLTEEEYKNVKDWLELRDLLDNYEREHCRGELF